LRIVPFNPTHDSNVEISVEWSKVSNAAIKKKKKEQGPQSQKLRNKK